MLCLEVPKRQAPYQPLCLLSNPLLLSPLIAVPATPVVPNTTITPNLSESSDSQLLPTSTPSLENDRVPEPSVFSPAEELPDALQNPKGEPDLHEVTTTALPRETSSAQQQHQPTMGSNNEDPTERPEISHPVPIRHLHQHESKVTDLERRASKALKKAEQAREIVLALGLPAAKRKLHPISRDISRRRGRSGLSVRGALNPDITTTEGIERLASIRQRRNRVATGATSSHLSRPVYNEDQPPPTKVPPAGSARALKMLQAAASKNKQKPTTKNTN